MQLMLNPPQNAGYIRGLSFPDPPNRPVTPSAYFDGFAKNIFPNRLKAPFALSLSKGFDRLSPNGILKQSNANPYQGVVLGAGPGPLLAAPRAVRGWGDCAQPSSAAVRGQSGVKRRTGEEAIYGHGPFRAVSRSASQPPRIASSAGHPQRSEGQALGAPAPYRPRGRADAPSADAEEFRDEANTSVPLRMSVSGVEVQQHAGGANAERRTDHHVARVVQAQRHP